MFLTYHSLLSPHALILGVVTYMLLGWLWYSPLLFGPLWANSINAVLKKPISGEDMHVGYLIGAALNGTIITFCLAFIRSAIGILTCTQAIHHATLLWVGLVVTTHFSTVIWQKKPIIAYLIEMTHWATTLILITCIVTQL